MIEITNCKQFKDNFAFRAHLDIVKYKCESIGPVEANWIRNERILHTYLSRYRLIWCAAAAAINFVAHICIGTVATDQLIQCNRFTTFQWIFFHAVATFDADLSIHSLCSIDLWFCWFSFVDVLYVCFFFFGRRHELLIYLGNIYIKHIAMRTHKQHRLWKMN